MAKKSTKTSNRSADVSELPSLPEPSKNGKVETVSVPRNDAPKEVAASVDLATEPEPVTVTDPITAKVSTVKAPLLVGLQGYCRRRVDVSLTRDQASSLKSLQHGLESKDAKLKNGKYVSTPTHAVAWLLENLGK